MWRTIIFTVVFMLTASGATGEYYKYTDENGNVRFTDDMTQIPENMRDSVDRFVSESPDDADVSESPVYSDRVFDTNMTDTEIPESYAAPSGDTFEVRAAELNKIQAELNKTRNALEQERTELAAQAPEEDATSDEKIAYRTRVDALNARIEKYGKDLKAFEEKVEAFNNRGRPEAK